jgi:alanine-synthesizing transaminase
LYGYSRRLNWTRSPNSFSRLVEEQRRAGAHLLDLTSANPTEVFDIYPHAEIQQAYARVDDFAYRPDPFGGERARQAIADWYGRRDIQVSSEQLALTASTSEAYALLFKLLCNPGDEVLVPAPSYPLFEYLARLESVEIVPYRLLYDGTWFVDFASMRAAISERTRAVVIVNPNNPTGSFLKSHETAELLTIAQEHNLPIVADEVFMDYPFAAFRDSARTLIGFNSVLSFSLGGLSKSAGMPQMKLAWIAVNGGPEVRADVRRRLELLLDTYLSVATPVQNALGELLTIGSGIARQIATRIERNRAALQEILKDSPVHVLHAEGGWSAILQLPNVRREEAWVGELIIGQRVLVQPGYFFDMASEPYAVASLLTPESVFDEGIQRIRTAIPD